MCYYSFSNNLKKNVLSYILDMYSPKIFRGLKIGGEKNKCYVLYFRKFLLVVQLDYTSLRGTEPESVYKTAGNKSSILQHFYTKCPFTPIFLSVNTAGNISELTNARKNRYITEKGFFNKTIERLEFPREFVNVISSLRRPNSKDYTISFVNFFFFLLNHLPFANFICRNFFESQSL